MIYSTGGVLLQNHLLVADSVVKLVYPFKNKILILFKMENCI